MAINKEDLFKELSGVHQQFSEATRRIFALMMKVQNMAESELSSIKGDLADVLGASSATQAAAAASAANAANSTTLELRMPPGVAEMPTAFVPQMNTQEAVDAGRQEAEAMATLSSNPDVQAALQGAKDVFKQALAKAGLPPHLAGLVEKVSVEDLNRHRAQHGQPQLPTAVEDAPFAKMDDKDLMLGVFSGVGGVFARYLHADVMFHGAGDLKPGFHPEGAKDPLKRYTQDGRWVDENSLRHWPTGFYTDRDSKMMQLLVNTDQAAILVGALPSEVSPVDVFVYGSKQGYRSLQSFDASELRLLHAKVDMTLAELAKKK